MRNGGTAMDPKDAQPSVADGRRRFRRILPNGRLAVKPVAEGGSLNSAFV